MIQEASPRSASMWSHAWGLSPPTGSRYRRSALLPGASSTTYTGVSPSSSSQASNHCLNASGRLVAITTAVLGTILAKVRSVVVSVGEVKSGVVLLREPDSGLGPALYQPAVALVAVQQPRPADLEYLGAAHDPAGVRAPYAGWERGSVGDYADRAVLEERYHLRDVLRVVVVVVVQPRDQVPGRHPASDHAARRPESPVSGERGPVAHE